MNELKTFLIRREGKVIMEGCTLPDNQCAVNSELPAHGCYPNFELLTKLQQRMGNRDIIFAPFLKDGAFYESRFNLIRNEDVGGLTGTGIIAVGCEFSDGLIVLQHTTETATTFWYTQIEDIEKLFGHNGKTIIVRV